MKAFVQTFLEKFAGLLGTESLTGIFKGDALEPMIAKTLEDYVFEGNLIFS